MLKRFIKDNVTDANAAFFSAFFEVLCRGDHFIEKKDPFQYTSNTLIIKKNTVIPIENQEWRSFIIEDNDIEISATHLDSGSFEVGKDYYIYLVDDDADGEFIISLNSTFPTGHNADDSRKIGGFHYGHIRKVSNDGLWIPIDSEGTKFGNGATIWKNNVTIGIVPNSVWDLKNRPSCSPEGMVKVGNIWVDIYLVSAAESITFENSIIELHITAGRLQSKYGQIPVSGFDGLNWYNFVELAARIKKRLLKYEEWIQAAFGNPQGEDDNDNYGWTKTTNTDYTRTGCMVDESNGNYNPATGVKPFAISAYNCVDTVGNLAERLAIVSTRWDEPGEWNFHDVLGVGKGQIWAPQGNAFGSIDSGGLYIEGIKAGPRAFRITSPIWSTSGATGSRFACNSGG
ncbi:MAG: hypothetical protein JXB88_26025 [Spirochaetales bacterium]|nr:hypothetical protein [Spirochaetales bacterium]